jgi:hypothetical protein
MKTKNRNARGGWPAILAAGTSILSAGLTMALASSLRQPAPVVGDILIFAPGEPYGDESKMRIAVHRPGQSGCVLDLDTIRRTGGSLVVEARVLRPIPGFRLHWAGERTSAESDDCGNSADVFLGKGDLSSLANEAGVYGLDPQHPSMIATAIAD